MKLNNIKRLFSCFYVLAVCLLSNIGVQAKAITTSPIINIVQNKQSVSDLKSSTLFTLNSNESISNRETKLAAHRSHVSHRSHQSHYSSRY